MASYLFDKKGMQTDMIARRSLLLSPFVLALGYAVFGVAYILFSDRILASLAGNYAHYQQLQTAKGWAFILLTALGLWLLLRWAWAELSRAAEVAIKAEDRLRLALTAAGGFVWQARPSPETGSEWMLTGGLARQLNLPEGQWIGFEQVAARLHPSDRAEFRRQFGRVAPRAGRVAESLLRFDMPDGSRRWIKLVPDSRSEAAASDEPLLGVAFDLTQQQEVSQDLAEVIFGAGLGTWRLDVASGKNQINDRYAEMLGYSRDEMEPATEQSFLDLVHPEDLARMFENRDARSKVGDFVASDEVRMRHKKGHWVWILSRSRPVDFAPDGKPSILSGVHIDISDRKALAEKLRLESDFLKRLIETSVSGIVALNDEGRIYFANKEATEILGLTPEKLIGQSLMNDDWTVTELDGRPLAPADFPSATVIATQATVRDRRVRIRRRDDGTRSISITAAPMRAPDGRLQVVATLTDITAQLENEALLQSAASDAMHAALHDPVTGLPNRELFEHALAEALAKALQSREHLLLVFLDIDNFKQVNDRFGHHAGDRLIRQVAARLETVRQGAQVLARVAGDEFTFLHPFAPGEDTKEVLGRLASVFEPPFELGGFVVHITVSMGLSVYPEDAATCEELWLNADLAMYEAKARGRNQTVRFTAPLRERQTEEARIAQILQRALKARSFEIVLMPLVDLRDGNQIVGAEALLRSTDPELQGIGPAIFLPVAERTGLMRALDLMVVDLVGAAKARLGAAGHGLRISVNLSPESLQEMGFGLELLARLDQAQLGAADVRFELTEGALVDLSSPAREVLDLLLARGFELSADDFGTGYSSLSYLHKLRLSELKIDRSFVQRLGAAQDPSDEIVRAILAMGQALGLSVLAEGIETEAQRDWLCRHGCDLGQGYLFGKGVDLDSFLQQHLEPKLPRSA